MGFAFLVGQMCTAHCESYSLASSMGFCLGGVDGSPARSPILKWSMLVGPNGPSFPNLGRAKGTFSTLRFLVNDFGACPVTTLLKKKSAQQYNTVCVRWEAVRSSVLGHPPQVEPKRNYAEDKLSHQMVLEWHHTSFIRLRI